jgi:hypothetical protein
VFNFRFMMDSTYALPTLVFSGAVLVFLLRRWWMSRRGAHRQHYTVVSALDDEELAFQDRIEHGGALDDEDLELDGMSDDMGLPRSRQALTQEEEDILGMV